MKSWSTSRDTQVLSTENHWQTEDTIKLCIHFIKLTFYNKISIGLMLDKASVHDCKGLLEHFESENGMAPKIHIGFVTENLTSVYSPFDLVVIKNLKANIRKQYDRVLVNKRKKLGEKSDVSREEVVSMVTSSFEEMNKVNEMDPYIRRGFDMCGLNPY